MQRNAIVVKDATYYLELGDGSTQRHIVFRDKQVRLLGKPKEGIQRFQTGLGHTAFTNESNVKPL